MQRLANERSDACWNTLMGSYPRRHETHASDNPPRRLMRLLRFGASGLFGVGGRLGSHFSDM